MGLIFGRPNPNYSQAEQLKFNNARQPKALPTAGSFASLIQVLKTTQQKLKHVQNAPSAPGVPQNFSATGIAGGIQLSWGQVLGADGYIVLRSATSDFSSPFAIKLPHKTQTFYLDAVGSGKTYYYRVLATSGTLAQPQTVQGNATATLSATAASPSPALTLAGNIASGVKLDGDAGLVNDRVLDVVFDNGGIGAHKPIAWHKANPGQTQTTVQLANGSTSSTSGWQKVATGSIDVPPGTNSITLNLSGSGSGSGTINFLQSGANIGISVTNGAGPSTPQVSGQILTTPGALTLTINNPPTGNGMTISIYAQAQTQASKFTSISVSCTVNLTTPFQSGTVT